MTSEWRMTRAALFGAVAGMAYGGIRHLIFGDPQPMNEARLVGLILGSGVGGAFLFAVAAAVRNAFVAHQPPK